MPNVKIIKNFSKFESENYQQLLGGVKGGVIENRKHKKFGMIATTYKISNADGYDDDKFDAAVLSACLSEQKISNAHSTFTIILRALTGKVSKGDSEP